MRRPIILTALATLAAAGVFLVFPGIDIAVAALFFDGQGFPLLGNFIAEATRDLFQLVFTALCVLSLVALVVSIVSSRRVCGLDWRRSAFLILSFGLGPGLLANYILKTHWGRARPNNIEFFGGDHMFTPPLIIADQCARNCSFVSGEASMAFSFLAVALLVNSPRHHHYVWIALALGGIMGLIRIGMGKHFLSDVIFAGLFTALIIMVLYHFLVVDKPPTAKASRRGTP